MLGHNAISEDAISSTNSLVTIGGACNLSIASSGLIIGIQHISGVCTLSLDTTAIIQGSSSLEGLSNIQFVNNGSLAGTGSLLGVSSLTITVFGRAEALITVVSTRTWRLEDRNTNWKLGRKLRDRVY